MLTIKDLVSEITEDEVIPKNHKREVIAIDDDCATGQVVGSHSIIKLTLKYGGESYALDLTGAQYGYYDPITPWPDYLNTQVLSFQSNNHLSASANSKNGTCAKYANEIRTWSGQLCI